MPFVIQASSPAVRRPPGRPFEDLAEAIQGIFVSNTEDAILLWNWVPVRIGYKYDLSVLIDDLIPLLNGLLGSTSGNYRAYWGSNSFRAEWDLRWAAGQLEIRADWQSVAGTYMELLNSRPDVAVALDAFLGEWRAPIRKVLETIDRFDVRMEDASSLDALRSIEAAIHTSGQLYTS